MNNGLYGYPDPLPDPKDQSTRGNLLDRPTACMARDGTFYYARNTLTLYRCNGTDWEAVATTTN